MAELTAHIEENQTLIDLAMQTYANPEALWKLAQENGLAELTQDLQPGGTLSYYATTDPAQEIYRRTGRRVATGARPLKGGAFNQAFAGGYDNKEVTP